MSFHPWLILDLLSLARPGRVPRSGWATEADGPPGRLRLNGREPLKPGLIAKPLVGTDELVEGKRAVEVEGDGELNPTFRTSRRFSGRNFMLAKDFRDIFFRLCVFL